MDQTPPWLWPGFGGSETKGSEPPATYFAFVEDITGVLCLDAAVGADGKSIDDLVWMVGKWPLRFRLSAVRTRHFGAIVDRFDILEPGDVGKADRDKRREQLDENVADLPIPLLEIYADPYGEPARWLRAVLQPGSWHYVEVRQNSFVEGFPPIVMGDPDLGDEFSFRGSLNFLSHVFPNFLFRLQDIFSLAHIPDARFDTEEGERGESEPLSGPDGPGGDKTAFTATEVQEQPTATQQSSPRYLSREA